MVANQPEAAILSSLTTNVAMYDHISAYNGCDMIVTEPPIVSKLVANATTRQQTSRTHPQSSQSSHQCLKSIQISL